MEHWLITKILWHTKTIYIFADPTKNRYNFDLFTRDSYCCVGCCHLKKQFDSLRKERSVPLTKWSGIACFKKSCGICVDNHCPRGMRVISEKPPPAGFLKKISMSMFIITRTFWVNSILISVFQIKNTKGKFCTLKWPPISGSSKILDFELCSFLALHTLYKCRKKLKENLDKPGKRNGLSCQWF